MKKEWYKSAYHRNVVDMHITASNEEFLTQFDSDSYVEMLKKTRAESAVVYTHSHVGLTYFPTRYGYMHPNLKGRDIFGEVNDKCHAAGISVVAYFSLIFDAWAYDNHPEWRIKNVDGNDSAGNDRYGVCCPNAAEYKKYIRNIVTELCRNYEFEGIRFDMTFWPAVCYCENCRDRFKEETGLELPKIINWRDPHWVSFQRSRERWLCEFAQNATDTVRKIKPGISVEHQSSTYTASYCLGVCADLRDYSDFLQGDFYGGYIQGSAACKMFYNLTPNLPFGFETSSNLNLDDHTTMKSDNMLFAKTCMAIANGGAFIFIDAIDPVGTLNPHVYETMAGVFKKTAPYEAFLGGRLVQDVGIYLSTESKFSFDDDGKSPAQAAYGTTHLDAVFSAARAMIKNHILFGILTRKSLDRLSEYKVVILPDVLMMSEEEVGAFREYVKNGGMIYASKRTSMLDSGGHQAPDFMLADVLGVHFDGETTETRTYLAPGSAGRTVFPDHVTTKYPLHTSGTQVLLKNDTEAEVVATLALPYFDSKKRRPYASIHSNPPGILTGRPAMTISEYGEGKAIYCASSLEDQSCHDEIFAGVVNLLLDGGATAVTDAPRQVEITLLDTGDSVKVNLLSFQEEMPNLPIPSSVVTVATGSRKVARVLHLPDMTNVEHNVLDGRVSFQTGGFDTFAMFMIEFSNS